MHSLGLPDFLKVAVIACLIFAVGWLVTRPAVLRVLMRPSVRVAPPPHPALELCLLGGLAIIGAAVLGTSYSEAISGMLASLEIVQGLLLCSGFIILGVVAAYGATLGRRGLLMTAYWRSRACRVAVNCAGMNFCVFFNIPVLVWLWEVL